MKLELAIIETPELEVGSKGPEFTLQGTDGKEHSLASFDSRFLVIIFMSNGCPTVRAYEDRLMGLQRDYRTKSVRLVGINSNNEHLSAIDSFEEMVRRARESGFTFPYLKDSGGSVAKAYGAVCTPHVFVLDGERRVRYRGRIDDARHESRVTSTDLRNALDDLLGEGPEMRTVRVAATEPFGCSIVW